MRLGEVFWHSEVISPVSIQMVRSVLCLGEVVRHAYAVLADGAMRKGADEGKGRVRRRGNPYRCHISTHAGMPIEILNDILSQLMRVCQFSVLKLKGHHLITN